jgi:hypothetical protein
MAVRANKLGAQIVLARSSRLRDLSWHSLKGRILAEMDLPISGALLAYRRIIAAVLVCLNGIELRLYK